MKHTLTLQFKSGTCETVRIGRFVAKRYTGDFESPELRAKAATSCWYSYVMGIPQSFALVGEGETVEESVADLRKRATETFEALNVAIFGSDSF